MFSFQINSKISNAYANNYDYIQVVLHSFNVLPLTLNASNELSKIEFLLISRNSQNLHIDISLSWENSLPLPNLEDKKITFKINNLYEGYNFL